MTKISKVAVVLVVAGLAAAGWFVFKPDAKPTTTTTNPATSQAVQATSDERGADPKKAVFIEVDDFRYEKPAGWAEISPQILKSNGSASGIGRPTEPVATFSIRVTDSIPKDNTDLRNSTLNELKKFTNFLLSSNTDTKVDSKSGQRFVYNFTDSEGKNKTAQQMSVIVHNNKTFFLLFSSADADYNKQTGEFQKILDSFKFK